jgi:hypothetical protein
MPSPRRREKTPPGHKVADDLRVPLNNLRSRTLFAFALFYGVAQPYRDLPDANWILQLVFRESHVSFLIRHKHETCNLQTIIGGIITIIMALLFAFFGLENNENFLWNTLIRI